MKKLNLLALIIFIIANSTYVQALSHQKISNLNGGVTGFLDDSDDFSESITNLGDLNGDGVPDLAVGTEDDDDGGMNRGAVWILFLDTNGTVKQSQKISSTTGWFQGELNNGDEFGQSVASLGDLDGDGISDLAVGGGGDDDGGVNRGAIWILFLNTDGTVKAHQKISATSGGFTGKLSDNNGFAESVESVGDLDGDSVIDIAVGAKFADDGGTNRGAVWILFLNTDGTVKANQQISSTAGNFTGQLDAGDEFGQSVAGINDLDGDGVIDIAVGAKFDDDGGTNRGAVWILFLNSDGTVKTHQKISDTSSGLDGTFLKDNNGFAESMEAIGDLNGDSIIDIAVGAEWDNDGGFKRGAVWIIYLNKDGTVKTLQKISNTLGGFSGKLDNGDEFGQSIAGLGDLDGDGLIDIAIGADGDDDGANNSGAVYIIFSLYWPQSNLLPFQQDLGNQGIVSLEAEHFHRSTPYNSHNWIPKALAGSSGNEAMQATPNIGVSITANYAPLKSPRLDFDVNFVKTGTHYIWVRGYGPGTGADSIHIGLDNAAIPSAGNMKSFSPTNSWVWCGDAEGSGTLARATINIPSTGLYTINAWMREDGFILDKIILTTDPNYLPTESGPGESEGEEFQQDLSNQGIVSIEAEHFHASTPYSKNNWTLKALAGSSGNEAMQATPNIGVSITANYAPLKSPRLDFDVNFVKTGTHYIWVRGYGPGTGADSIHIGLDNAAIPSAGNMKSFSPTKSWVWCGDAEGIGTLARATINILSTGPYTINAWMREDGFIFDKIVLTTDPDYVPSGFGPGESPLGGSDIALP